MLAIATCFGIWLGLGLSGEGGTRNDGGWQKVEQIMQYIENDYVDTISRETLEDEVVAYLLQRLDPHSYYINEEDVAAMNEPLEGGFEGVGIQFNLDNDTVYVINTIENGPAYQAGILPGDKIVSADGEEFLGKNIDTRQVMAMLKGPAGTEVNVSVIRNGNKTPLSFDLVRGQIPLKSIDAVYMINDSTIYVRLARFAKTTYEEFKTTVYPLKSKKVNYFILDLRGNGGGFLDAAVDLADEFLKKDQLVTYTQGKSRPRMDYKATDAGVFTDTKLYVVIDGYTASASEIFAGAMQDHKRAVIVGKRSFGKGLVQEQSEWSDGSATRLTVARYYTPQGRSIQRPYESFAEQDDYYITDSTASAVGGIVPDVEVKNDTTGITWLYADLVHRALLNDFVYHYRDSHYASLKELTEDAFISTITNEEMLREMRIFLDTKSYEIDESEWARSAYYMATRSKALVARSLFGDRAYYRIFNPTDNAIGLTLETIKKPRL